MRKTIFSLLSLSVAGVLVGACSSGNEKTPDGGTIYTSAPPNDIACSSDSDCCVAIDQCHSVAYVIHAGDSLQIAQTNCNLCIAPAVQVWCANGKCQNAVVPFDQNTPQQFLSDHCGPITLPDAGTVSGSDAGSHGCGG
jgi:hypothetical protein